MSKLNNVVKNDVGKKAVYDKLVTKINNINTNDFGLEAKYQKDNTELEKVLLKKQNSLK